MAVPFSRPTYQGQSSPSRRSSNTQDNTQRPSSGGAGTPPSSPPRANQTSSVSDHQHPVTRFLFGDGQVHLDNLSLTSRIAFYALYEAWRLLQDLSSTSQSRLEFVRPSSDGSNPESGAARTAELVGGGHNSQTDADSTRWCVGSANGSPLKSCPAKAPPLAHLASRPASPLSALIYPRAPAPSEAQHPTHHPDLVQNVPDDLKVRSGSFPDVVPEAVDRCYHDHHDQGLIWAHPSTAYWHKEQEQDYLGKRHCIHCGRPRRDDIAVGLVDRHKSGPADEVDCAGMKWVQVGRQLCEIASAFEVTYYPPSTEQQKQAFAIYQRIKASTSQQRHRDNTLIGLARELCRQILLSSIWILLKKVL